MTENLHLAGTGHDFKEMMLLYLCDLVSDLTWLTLDVSLSVSSSVVCAGSKQDRLTSNMFYGFDAAGESLNLNMKAC